MKSIINVLFLAVMVVFSTCKEDDPEPSTGTISGKITDSVTGLAIEGANVHTQPGTSAVNSNASGDYTIANVVEGSYTVTADKTDYISTDVKINVTGGNTTTANIALTPIAVTPTNNPPNKPQNVAPTPGAVDQPSSVTLSWSGSDPDGDALTYEVLFGTTNPPTNAVSSGSSDTELIQDGLNFSTNYYWQVIAKDANGAVTSGDVWEFATAAAPAAQEVFSEDFASGMGTWSADNGQWQIGVATAGPAAAHSEGNVAGTILDGDYFDQANSRLISPTVVLPTLMTGEKIQMKFWDWHSFASSNDIGRIQISVDGGDWETISLQNITFVSAAWTQHVTDLSAYAGLSVRIAFYFTSGSTGTDTGWYVDDVSIEKKIVSNNNPDDLELGVGDWGADNGQWQIGKATVGPDNAHSGENVAGTILDGDYFDQAGSRLISPIIVLPSLTSGEQIQLKYWDWHSFASSNDIGRIQISIDGGEWETISSQNIDGVSAAWTQHVTDLSDYSGLSVRVAFYFTSGSTGTDVGWYIDDVSIEKI